MNLLRALFLLLVCLSAALFSGCGVLIGNIKPVDEKAENYGVADLSKEKPLLWTKLDPIKVSGVSNTDPATTSTEVSDAAYQSKKNASIISVNSACREVPDDETSDLHQLTNLLYLGLTDITQRSEQALTIQKTPALETTIEGRLNSEPMKLRSVVLRRSNCVYDLVYMARPQHFGEHEQDFSHFVASLKLK